MSIKIHLGWIFRRSLSTKSKHWTYGITLQKLASTLSYAAGPADFMQVRHVPKLDQQADEFIDIEGQSDSNKILFGMSRLSHHYGILMVQLGEAQVEFESKSVGISNRVPLAKDQLDMTMTEFDLVKFVNCAQGYFRCQYAGLPVYLCGEMENWKMLRSIRTVKGGPRELKISDGFILNLEQNVDCIKNINSFVSAIEAQKPTQKAPPAATDNTPVINDQNQESEPDPKDKPVPLTLNIDLSEDDEPLSGNSVASKSNKLEDLLKSEHGAYYSKYESKTTNTDPNHEMTKQIQYFQSQVIKATESNDNARG